MDPRFDRVAIVGTSCSGKTTLARQLAAVLASNHVELDALHWGPNWTATPAHALRPRVERALSAPRWVCDGNYGAVRDVVWGRATAIVWLNYSFPLVLSRALRRTIRRVVTRERLYAGNQESFAQGFLSRESILLWVISTHRSRHRTYRDLFSRDEHAHLHRVELRATRETREFLAGLETSAPRAVAAI